MQGTTAVNLYIMALRLCLPRPRLCLAPLRLLCLCSAEEGGTLVIAVERRLHVYVHVYVHVVHKPWPSGVYVQIYTYLRGLFIIFPESQARGIYI